VKRILKRFGRSLVSVLLAGATVYGTKDPRYIVLAPLLNALGKYLRDKFGIKYVPI